MIHYNTTINPEGKVAGGKLDKFTTKTLSMALDRIQDYPSKNVDRIENRAGGLDMKPMPKPFFFLMMESCFHI